MVEWSPPAHSNGELLRYTVYQRDPAQLLTNSTTFTPRDPAFSLRHAPLLGLAPYHRSAEAAIGRGPMHLKPHELAWFELEMSARAERERGRDEPMDNSAPSGRNTTLQAQHSITFLHFYIFGDFAVAFIQCNLQPSMHTFTHRRWSQPHMATASSSGAVGVRRLAQGHLDAPLGGAGDRTSNLPVTSRPAGNRISLTFDSISLGLVV